MHPLRPARGLARTLALLLAGLVAGLAVWTAASPPPTSTLAPGAVARP